MKEIEIKLVAIIFPIFLTICNKSFESYQKKADRFLAILRKYVLPVLDCE